MGHREAVLVRHGYVVRYEINEKYRSAEKVRSCIAERNGVRCFAFKIFHPDRPEHYDRIQKIQASIVRMARMVGPIDDVVLLEDARGQMLWEMETAPDAAVVESQLAEFATSIRKHGLIHGDLRPWNVFFDREYGVQVIDWWCLSAFVDDLMPEGALPARRADLLGDGHYSKFHPDLVAAGRITDIDLADVRIIGRLLREELDLDHAEAWGGAYRSLGRFRWQRS